MDGESRTSLNDAQAPVNGKKSKKFRFKRLVKKSLGTLMSGMIFGIGCVIIDRIDNWAQSEEVPEKVVVDSHVPTKGLGRSDH